MAEWFSTFWNLISFTNIVHLEYFAVTNNNVVITSVDKSLSEFLNVYYMQCSKYFYYVAFEGKYHTVAPPACNCYRLKSS